MGPFATATIILEAIFWIGLLSVAGVFLAALIKGTIEDISDHRRILAARLASAAPPLRPGQSRGPRGLVLPAQSGRLSA
jgi:hypothetical protein